MLGALALHLREDSERGTALVHRYLPAFGVLEWRLGQQVFLQHIVAAVGVLLRSLLIAHTATGLSGPGFSLTSKALVVLISRLLLKQALQIRADLGGFERVHILLIGRCQALWVSNRVTVSLLFELIQRHRFGIVLADALQNLKRLWVLECHRGASARTHALNRLDGVLHLMQGRRLRVSFDCSVKDFQFHRARIIGVSGQYG